MIFWLRKTRFPKTMQWDSIDHFIEALNNVFPHEFPFLIKEDRRHEAEGIHIIRDDRDIDVSLNKISKRYNLKTTRFISQDFIYAKGNALRVVIMEDSYISYWKRAANPGQEISTISNGAIVDKKWEPQLQEKGIKMAKLLSEKTGINLAAVDFIFDLNKSDPDPLLLEINYSFGRTGLGGTINYYKLLFKVLTKWMEKNGFDSTKVKLV